MRCDNCGHEYFKSSSASLGSLSYICDNCGYENWSCFYAQINGSD